MRRTAAFVGMMAIACVMAGTASANLVVNGDFESGLDNWVATNVNPFSGVAQMVDAEVTGAPADSQLLQFVPMAPGCYYIDFDFLGLLSQDAGNGMPDTLFASLYFTDDMVSFSGQTLFDMDYSGISNNNGTITPIVGTDVLHFHMAFNNTNAYAVPLFDLANLNGMAGDSVFFLDNVSIERRLCDIPEPATMLLLGLGVAVAAVRKAMAK